MATISKINGYNLIAMALSNSNIKITEDGTFDCSELANSSNADNLFPAIDQGIKLYYTTNATDRTNWPVSKARSTLLVYRLTSSYGVQFCWGNTELTIYMRVYNNGTWGAWKSITFS